MKRPVFNPEWSEEIRALYRHDMQEIWDSSIAPQVWNQYHNQLEQYLAFVPGIPRLEILDVGCAQATLALLLAEAGHKVWALDLRQEFLDYAATRFEHGELEFIRGNVLELELDKRFDLIFANQIIEHLVYPLDMILRLKGLLKPGGRLVVTTPNGEYLKNSLPSFNELGDPVQWESRQFTADGDGHFFAYTGDELTELFAQAGLADIELQFFETPWISGHMKIRYLHGYMDKDVLKKLDRCMLKIPVIGRRFSHQALISGRYCE